MHPSLASDKPTLGYWLASNNNVSQKEDFNNFEQELKDKYSDNFNQISIRGLKSSSMYHILDEHTGNIEIKRGQIPLAINNFYELPTTLNNIIDIEYEGKNKDGQDVYRFTCLNNGKYTILEAISNKNRSLTIDTMWKTKEQILNEVIGNQSSNVNRETSVLNKNISQEQDNVNSLPEFGPNIPSRLLKYQTY